MKKYLYFIVIGAILLCGCGYTTRSSIVVSDPTIYVANFVNKIDIAKETSDANVYYGYRPSMERDITTEIINRFIFDGNYQITDMKKAHFLLKGELINFRREPLRYGTDDNVVEYRLHVSCNIGLYDQKKNKLVWEENNFAGEGTYRTTGEYTKSESTALQEAIEDLARRIVERTVEDW